MDAESLEALASILNVLSSPSRLSLLSELQRPRTVSELTVPPSREDAGLNHARGISRQSIERHLDILGEAGLVTWTTVEGKGRPAKAFVLNHARLFAAMEELRVLTRLRAGTVEPETTMDLSDAPPPDPESVPGPRFVVVRGVPESGILPIPDQSRSVLGRGADADLRLDHDPFVSTHHCVLQRDGDAVAVLDEGRARNGTLVNGRRAPPAQPVALRRGNLVAIGRSLLLYLD